MQLVASNQTIEVPPGTQIDYYQNNPVLIAAKWVEQVQLAAETENYLGDQLQYLFQIDSMELWGPSGGDYAILDPTKQDNKMDFQKQNLKVCGLEMPGWCEGGLPWTLGRGPSCVFPTKAVRIRVFPSWLRANSDPVFRYILRLKIRETRMPC